jgi:hypothetical protein
MNGTVKQKENNSNPKCNFFLLRLIHRKYYLKQLTLEYLLTVETQNPCSSINIREIEENIDFYYTKGLFYNTPAALLIVCLYELQQLNFIDVVNVDGVFFYKISEEGIESLKSFELQNIAATTFSNFINYRLTLLTVTISILALIISIIAILLKF